MKQTEVANTQARFPVRLLTPMLSFCSFVTYSELLVGWNLRRKQQIPTIHTYGLIVQSSVGKRLNPGHRHCGLVVMGRYGWLCSTGSTKSGAHCVSGSSTFGGGAPRGISIRTSSHRLASAAVGGCTKWKWRRMRLVIQKNRRCFWWFLGYYKS